MFLEIIKNISEVDNKIRYTLQEETYMNRKLMFNIISEIILEIRNNETGNVPLFNIMVRQRDACNCGSAVINFSKPHHNVCCLSGVTLRFSFTL